MIETLKEVIGLIGIFVGLISALSTFIIKNSKNAKVRKTAENINRITGCVNAFVIYAEDFINYSGEEKKEWVITKVNQFAIENKID